MYDGAYVTAYEYGEQETRNNPILKSKIKVF